jgi:hypothetical protein
MFTVGIFSPKNRAFIRRISDYFGFRPGAPKLSIPSVDLNSILPDDISFRILESESVDGNVTLFELMALVKLSIANSSRSIFEIGTFDGRTTLNLAANTSPEAKVFTLDLPREKMGNAQGTISKADIPYIDKTMSGARFVGSKYEHKITQLYGDSAVFDFSDYYDNIDFVFVDGAHTYDYLINDTDRAVKMLRSGKGAIAWHDYGRDNGATRALNDLFINDARFRNITRINKTSLVIGIF